MVILAVDECPWLEDAVFAHNYNAFVHDLPQAALSAIRTEQPEVVLVSLDIGLDTSLSFISDIRREKSLINIPIILIGKNPGLIAIQQGINAGATDFVSRLEDPQLIRSRIEIVLNRQRQIDHQASAIAELRNQRQIYERMVRMVIHDLKHPITNITMIGELLRGMDEPEMQATILDSLDAASGSIKEILDDFAAASNIYADQSTLTMQPVDVQRMLNEVVLGNFASALRKQMQFNITPTNLRIRADGERLRRVLNNLVSNAIKYAPQGSTITIEASANDLKRVRISVTDEGPGIPLDEQHLLFQEFGKLSTRPTGEELSTGLGLWIARSLVETMRGQIGLDTESSRGATFWVELPAAG